MRCAIWYHLHNLKKVKSSHGGVLFLTKISTLPWEFFAQMVLNRAKHHICSAKESAVYFKILTGMSLSCTLLYLNLAF